MISCMVMNHLVPPRTPEQLTTPLDLQRESLMRSSDARRKCTPPPPLPPLSDALSADSLFVHGELHTLFPLPPACAHTHKKAGGVRKAW